MNRRNESVVPECVVVQAVGIFYLRAEIAVVEVFCAV
jgi:hypothetical protein